MKTNNYGVSKFRYINNVLYITIKNLETDSEYTFKLDDLDTSFPKINSVLDEMAKEVVSLFEAGKL